MAQKLDPATKKAWNLRFNDSDTPPTQEELDKFLSNRIRALEECAPPTASKSAPKSSPSSRVHVATASANSQSECQLCRSHHYLHVCPDFVAKNPSQRREVVKQLKRCFNCLRAAHSSKDCKSKYSCRSCQKRHHTLLHTDSDSSSTTASKSDASPSAVSDAPKAEITSLLASTKSCSHTQILLATALVQVRVDSGRSATVRALLDQGSEATFISEHLAQVLRAKRIRMPVSISAVGGNPVCAVRHAASITVSPRASREPALVTTALILNSLTSYVPKRRASLASLPHLEGLSWADDNPTNAEPIQIILGADLYSDVILEGVRKGERGQPIAQESIFGWVLSGPLASHCNESQNSGIPSATSSKVGATLTVHHLVESASLEDEIRRFWESEEIPPLHYLSPQDEKCELHFLNTHSRSSDGRYTVRLPFKSGPPIDIGKSRQTAERLLNSTTRRFRSNPSLAKDYKEFMHEYEKLGHMMRAAESVPTTGQCVYLPHHPVFRAGSATTRVRVVFNASSVTSNGTSLNNHLAAGPKLQTDLPSILVKWRNFKYVYMADIAKMYRQIQIDERDINYQRILWQTDNDSAPVAYCLLTVTYGTICAPFLALRVLKALIADDGPRFPLAVPILRDQTYVDDVLFGGDDVESLRKARDQLTSLLDGGKFKLRKWASNSAALLQDIDPSDHGLACDKDIATDESLKILGITWSPARDVFQFKVSLAEPIPRSKRSILSTIAKLYDPLGWVTPATILAKIFMQTLWTLKISWDEALPLDTLARWEAIWSKLNNISRLQIERWTGASEDLSHAELHGFADASTAAYAAVVFLKVISPSGEVKISLLAGKSKVAPISPLTVPRLELSAALLLSRLLMFIRRALSLDKIACFCWTDSTIVLHWLRSHPSRWKTFVANRVQQIQQSLTDAAWRYVPTAENPADCASRGLLADDLVTHPLWWHGPEWLKHSAEAWPDEPESRQSESSPEEKPVGLHSHELVVPWALASWFSSWPTLIRVTAYLIKFIRACRTRTPEAQSVIEPGTALSAGGCHFARSYWLKQIQAELFADDLRRLRGNSEVSEKSSLAALHPFLDADGILRVGGRLRHAPIPYRRRHPIVLASHPLVDLIVRQTHLRALHSGTQLTLNLLRQDFWVLRARGIVRKIIHECVVCVRERAATPSQLMGDLPRVRVAQPSRVFSHCGVDYAGPVYTRASAGRGIKTNKAYIALFVCLSTRAIHLELVGDYSTTAFLGAYARFCSRRGLPSIMYSDNGRTFVGADRDLKKAYQAAVRDPNFQNKTAIDRVTWKFIPPSAPHFGGLWEAGVRSVKHHLRRVLGERVLSFEEFTTLLCQIEACLNSRPISPLSDSFDDLECLTPGHFLIGSALTVAPEPSLLDINENRLSRWQIVRHVTERFWKIWATDYVNTLQQRSKWRKMQPSVALGQLVLLRNQTLPPCKWELGRIVNLHPGADALTRVVTVKTATSEYKRPITKLCLLPVTDDSSNS